VETAGQIKLPNGRISRYADRRLWAITLRLATIEGCFSIVMIGLTQAFYVPYLNAMGATTLQIGLGVSLPALMTGLIQFYTPVALHKVGSRKKLVMLTCFAQALCFIPFGLFCHLQTGWRIWPSITAFVVSAITGSLGSAAWMDWMGHLVPRRRRGKYFAFRNRIFGLIQLVIAVSASYMLDHSAGKLMLMFTTIWFACFAFRAISAALMGFYYEADTIKDITKPTTTFRSFITTLHSSHFGRFTLAVSLMWLAVSFAGPFFPVHMLNDLKLSYVKYIILQQTPTVTVIIVFALWGWIVDRVGNILPIRFCAILLTLLPLPWVITDNYFALLLTMIVAGFAWAGFGLATFNYTLDALEPKIRVSSIAYYNVIVFVCMFLGSTLGGWVAPHLPKLTAHRLEMLFLISAVLRVGPTILFYFVGVEKKRYAGPLTALERFFLYPRLNLRTGLIRSIIRYLRGPV